MATTITTEDVWVGFRQRLYGYIRARSRSSADADDILQNVFVKVHRRVDTLADEARLSSWLYRVTHNEIIDYYRKYRPTPCGTPTPPRADVGDDWGDDASAERTLAPFLRELIDVLPPSYRAALTLTEIEGLTQQEMGRRLGLSISGAKSRVQRGRTMLRNHLLDCCQVDLDSRSHVIDYTSRSGEPWPEDCPCAPKER